MQVVEAGGNTVQCYANAMREKAWVFIGAETGETFVTGIDNGTKTGKMEGKAVKYSCPSQSLASTRAFKARRIGATLAKWNMWWTTAWVHGNTALHTPART